MEEKTHHIPNQRFPPQPKRIMWTVMEHKRALGQYYTTGNPFGHPAFLAWAKSAGLPGATVMEPFAGGNSLIRMLEEQRLCSAYASYDIAPGAPDVVARDSLASFPTGYQVVVTNPPYLAKNSAKRRGLAFPDTGYDDLYKHALAITLDHTPWVAAIVPDSLFTSGLFLDRAMDYVSLPQSMFADTEHPVCLALFGPAPRAGGPRLWVGTRDVGTMEEVKARMPWDHTPHPWRFNDPQGPIGLVAIDNQQGPSIRFVQGATIPSGEIKHSSRSLTRIGAGFLADSRIPPLLDAANAVLDAMRAQTHDVLMTSFKGTRKDGFYRRRLDFATTRHILNTALTRIQDDGH